MKYRLIDIGRSKVNRTVEVRTERELVREVRKHLMSRDVEILPDGNVWAGMRTVGRVELVVEGPQDGPHSTGGE